MGSAVDEYPARLPTEQRQALEQLRQAIESIVPGVEEVIRSGELGAPCRKRMRSGYTGR
jgi:hypothetical protein